MKVKIPKVIFIDWFDTLSRSKFWGHLEKSTNNTNIFTRIENYLFKTDDGLSLLKPWMKAEMTSEDISKKVSKELLLDYNLVIKEFIRGCEMMEFVSPEVPKLIKKLQSYKIKVYIASNNMDSFDRWTIPAMNLHGLFDGIINSYSIRALKHDFDENQRSLFFDTVLMKEKVKPKETILIDDSEDKQSLLSTYGIDYRRISDSNTLVNELQSILG